ncbi:MAG: hypothetical protein EA401_01725 [Planctomycetota bacterium]|nr:MAG: hypothetical protein EA401_01725 [Planctomycetota bacterium]
MRSIQALYRVLSWLAWGSLVVLLVRPIPGLYYYSLDWHRRFPLPDSTHSDPIIYALAHGQTPNLLLIALASLPMLCLLAVVAWYWQRQAQKESRGDCFPLALCALSSIAAYTAFSALAELRWELEVWLLLSAMPEDDYHTSLTGIVFRGAAQSLPGILIFCFARPLFNAWGRWQQLVPQVDPYTSGQRTSS